MKPGSCCEGDYNPWRREPICTHCNDLRIVSTTDTHRRSSEPEKSELTPCPYCGDPVKREKLKFERYKTINPPPEISEKDLTPEERELVKDWRNRGFHAADCLRWIEGRRYEPSEDKEFLVQVERELGQWKRLSGGTKPKEEWRPTK